MQELLDQDVLEEVREMWLEDVYDVKSTLQNDAWLQAVTTKGNWIFNAVELRKKIFEQSKVQIKHFK